MGDFNESNLSKREKFLKSLLKQNLVKKKHVYWGSNLKKDDNDFRNSNTSLKSDTST